MWSWEKKYTGGFESLWGPNAASHCVQIFPHPITPFHTFFTPDFLFHSQSPQHSASTSSPLNSMLFFAVSTLLHGRLPSPVFLTGYLLSTVCVSHISWKRGERLLNRANYTGSEPLKKGGQTVSVIGAVTRASPQDMRWSGGQPVPVSITLWSNHANWRYYFLDMIHFP